MKETATTTSKIVTVVVSLALLLAVVSCEPLNPGDGGIVVDTRVPSPSPHFGHENTIVLSTHYLEDSVGFKKIKLLYTEAFFRMGYSFELIHLPAERSLADADTGRVDGEAMRHQDLQSGGQYPNLIRVDERILATETSVYSFQATTDINGWDDLSGTGHVFVVERGDKIVQVELPRYVAPDQIVETENVEQAIAMLEAGRADMFVGTAMVVETILQRAEHSESGVHKIGIVRTGYGYPYLHKKHSDLVPRLTAILKEMKEDGTYQRLMGQD